MLQKPKSKNKAEVSQDRNKAGISRICRRKPKSKNKTEVRQDRNKAGNKQNMLQKAKIQK